MFSRGDIICIGSHVGTFLSMVSPHTAQIELATGEYATSRIELLETYSGDIYAMARLSKAQKAEKEAAEKGKSTTAGLAEAVKFCAPGYKETGEPYAQFAMIWGKWITTYNGVVMYGHPIPDELQACPHFGQLAAVLKAAGSEPTSITQIDNNRLAIKCGKVRSVVKCLSDYQQIVRHAPDTPVGPITSNIREGFEVMKQVASKSGELVLTASVLIEAGSMFATDRHLLVAFWHGLAFPTLTVPADFVEAVLRVPKSLTSFGYTDTSLTFYFEDGSFIRTQLYAEKWPDINSILPNDYSRMKPIPDGMFEAFERCKPFMETNAVLFDNGLIRTHEEIDVGCVVEVPGIEEAPSGIDAVRLYGLRNRVTHMDYLSDENKVSFAGENVRGVCTNFLADEGAGRSPTDPSPPPSPEYAPEPVQAAPYAYPPEAYYPPEPPEAPEYEPVSSFGPPA